MFQRNLPAMSSHKGRSIAGRASGASVAVRDAHERKVCDSILCRMSSGHRVAAGRLKCGLECFQSNAQAKLHTHESKGGCRE